MLVATQYTQILPPSLAAAIIVPLPQNFFNLLFSRVVAAPFAKELTGSIQPTKSSRSIYFPVFYFIALGREQASSLAGGSLDLSYREVGKKCLKFQPANI